MRQAGDNRTADLFLTVPKPRARRTDPGTSHAAAKVAEKSQPSYANRIMDALRYLGEGTIYEIGARCGLDHVQVARVMSNLAKATPPLARVKQGEFGDVCRPGGTGTNCRVWEPASLP